MARRMGEGVIAGSKPGHPYIGVCYEPEDAALANGTDLGGYGVLVTPALSGTPAANAGLKSGDVIEKVGDVALNNGETLGGAIQLHSPGETVQLTVLRGGKPTTIPPKLGDRPAAASAAP